MLTNLRKCWLYIFRFGYSISLQLAVGFFSCLAETNTVTFSKEMAQVWLNQSRPKAFFEENRGQFQSSSNAVAQEILYVLKGKTDSFYLRPNGWSFVKSKWIEEESATQQPEKEVFGKKIVLPRGSWLTHRVDVNLLGCNIKANVEGQKPLEETRNYANVRDSNPVEGVKLFEKVVYHDWLPGVDVAFALDEGQLIYEFIIHSFSKLKDIEWKVNYAHGIEAKSNRFIFNTEIGPVINVIESAYRIRKDGSREEIYPICSFKDGKLKLTSFFGEKKEQTVIRLKQI